MPSYIRQTNFLGGELDPLYHGRTDLPVWGVGLRTCRNFFVDKRGSLVSRPGTQYLGDAKGTDISIVRLIPFIYTQEQSYCLELTKNWMRLWTLGQLVQIYAITYTGRTGDPWTVGATVTDGTASATIYKDWASGTSGTLWLTGAPTGGSFSAATITENVGSASATCGGAEALTPFEIATPWAESELREIQYAQTGDVMVLTHKNHPAQELKRLGDTDWTLTPIVLTGVAAMSNAAYLKKTVPTGDASAGYPAAEWAWGVTQILADAYGNTWETNLKIITQQATNGAGDGAVSLPNQIACYPNYAVTVYIGNTAAPTGFRRIAFWVYRGRKSLFGFVGETDDTAYEFTDIGRDPDYSRQPPRGGNPFDIYDPETPASLLRSEEPIACAFFEDRLALAGTTERPTIIALSKQGIYNQFDQRLVNHVDEESMLWDLAARRREDIRTMLPHSRLLVGTGTALWSIGGQQGSPLVPASIDACVVEEIGVEALPMLVVDGTPLYVAVKGQTVRALVPNNSRAWYGGRDISAMSAHLLRGKPGQDGITESLKILDWTFEDEPWGLVWAVRDDGGFLSLTYSAAGQYAAWARHDTDGDVLSVCSIPETNRDATYVAVRRRREGVDRISIERMLQRLIMNANTDGWGLDCAVMSSQSPSATLTGLEHLNERTDVYVVGAGNPLRGPYTVANGQLTMEAIPNVNTGIITGAAQLWVGLLFTAELETLDAISAETRTKQKTVTRIGLELDYSAGCEYGPDLDHLKEVRWHSVESGYSPPVPKSRVILLQVKDGWANPARIALRQAQPYPVTVVGLVREIVTGGG